jgi:hypothetical protein
MNWGQMSLTDDVERGKGEVLKHPLVRETSHFAYRLTVSSALGAR